MEKIDKQRCIKSVPIRSYCGPYFPVFGLSTKRYGVFFRIQFKCGKIRTKITPTTDTFYAVKILETEQLAGSKKMQISLMVRNMIV